MNSKQESLVFCIQETIPVADLLHIEVNPEAREVSTETDPAKLETLFEEIGASLLEEPILEGIDIANAVNIFKAYGFIPQTFKVKHKIIHDTTDRYTIRADAFSA